NRSSVSSSNWRDSISHRSAPSSVPRVRFRSADSTTPIHSAWRDLIELCRVLNETPPEALEQELGKRMNLDSLLWFLALDVALINNDGYWTRSSDYALYQDTDGVFHILPHDMNEAFQGTMGGPMGMGG